MCINIDGNQPKLYISVVSFAETMAPSVWALARIRAWTRVSLVEDVNGLEGHSPKPVRGTAVASFPPGISKHRAAAETAQTSVRSRDGYSVVFPSSLEQTSTAFFILLQTRKTIVMRFYTADHD